LIIDTIITLLLNDHVVHDQASSHDLPHLLNTTLPSRVPNKWPNETVEQWMLAPHPSGKPPIQTYCISLPKDHDVCSRKQANPDRYRQLSNPWCRDEPLMGPSWWSKMTGQLVNPKRRFRWI
jgi:hypothetical protein